MAITKIRDSQNFHLTITNIDTCMDVIHEELKKPFYYMHNIDA